ncbi:hypothetical protein EMCG_01303 [[Emmonsia] crescens]|uniref:Uncharacterized protein n=1 Tax=[Emmonsia] crescens TaxID=73230 RepID=A0A0G2I3U1_9EURO|nr:hypothetical protein EMCG_01303 [Emmonsia crescens UAMH 3008]
MASNAIVTCPVQDIPAEDLPAMSAHLLVQCTLVAGAVSRIVKDPTQVRKESSQVIVEAAPRDGGIATSRPLASCSLLLLSLQGDPRTEIGLHQVHHVTDGIST